MSDKPLKGKRILWIDDDGEVLAVLSKVLEGT